VELDRNLSDLGEDELPVFWPEPGLVEVKVLNQSAPLNLSQPTPAISFSLARPRRFDQSW
jgi:hypothetical protein